jgi:shikimate kinase
VQPDRAFHNLALIGFMGTGKSSVGRLAASQLQFDFVDTDELIEETAGAPIAEIFARQGEPAFRRMERSLVAGFVNSRRKVIATGGGLAANAENLALLKQNALVICLWASLETIYERVAHQTHRPLLKDPDPRGKIRGLLAEREPFYRQADVLISTDQRT